ncbi:S-layer homology domain-containing protein [Slackia piriformis]|nr:S-layer homology domain-containing protein [Slackia piriformis]
MGTTANKLGRTFLSGALAVTLALPVVGVQKAEAAAGFPDWDVQTNAWYVPYIEWAVENGVVSGYPNGTFAPDQNVTRGQFAIMLARAVGVEVDNDAADNATPFTDNVSDQYYTAAVNWAYENGILTGYDGKVRPDDSMARQEAAAMLGRFAGSVLKLYISTGELEWPSGTIGQNGVPGYAYNEWLWLANTGVLQGNDVGDGTFVLDPKGNFTRAQTAKVVTVLIRDVAPEYEDLNPDAPRTVKAVAKTAQSVTVAAYDKYGNDITSKCEFTTDPILFWQDSPVFDKEPAGWTFTVYARLKAPGDRPASAEVKGEVTTAEYEYSGVIGSLEATKIDQRGATIVVKDKAGNDITNQCEFCIDQYYEEEEVWQDSPTFENLSVDFHYTYHVRVKATGSSEAHSFSTAAFDTTDYRINVTRITRGEVTRTSGTMYAEDSEGNDITALCQWRLRDGGEWQDSNVFTGLEPGKRYSVDCRVKPLFEGEHVSGGGGWFITLS